MTARELQRMKEPLAVDAGTAAPGDSPVDGALAGAHDVFRLAFDAAPFGTCLVAPDGCVLRANAALGVMFGLDSHAVVGKNWRDFTYPVDAERYRLALAGLVAGHTDSFQQRVRYRRADGSEAWADLATSCLRTADGSLDCLVAQAVDVTNQVTNEQLLGAILQAQTTGLMVFRAIRDHDGTLVDLLLDYVNDAIRVATPDRALEGGRFSVLFPQARANGQFEALCRVIETGEALDRDLTDEDAGFGGWFHSRAVKLGDGCVVTIQDITATREAVDSLRRSEAVRDRAERIGGTGSWRLDLATQRLEWSPGLYALVDAAPDELDGDPERLLAARVHPDDAPLLEGRLAALRAGRGDGLVAYRVIHRDGTVHALECHSEIEHDAQGRPVAALGGVRDVTDRQQIEEALRRRVAELNALQRLSDLLAQRLDLHNALDSACRLLADLFSARAVTVRLPANGHRGYVAGVGGRRAADAAAAAATLAVLESLQDEPEPIAQHEPRLLALPLVAHGETVGAVAVVRDTQEPAFSQSEEAVICTAADLLASVVWTERLHVIETQQAALNERQRLAQELHDSALQSIYSAGLMAEALANECPTQHENDDSGDDLFILRRLIRGALAEMRTLLFELRPETFTTTLLEAQLRGLADALEARGEMSVELDLETDVSLPHEAHMTFFRTAQESLRNVARHAGAEHVQVTLARDGDLVRLSVRDDGSGFAASAPPAETSGLHSMQERARRIGATLQIESAPGGGTTVTLAWPAAAVAAPAS